MCTARTNRDVAKTLVGMSNWPGEPYFQGKIAGLYVVDHMLSETEISETINRMCQGGDTLQACQTCPADTVSLQGSTSQAECECLAGSYKSVNTADAMALMLVPGRTELSTLANRDVTVYTATAVFDPTAGPLGSRGAVTFDKTSSQYIDGGAHTFNIASNGGFPAIAVVKFTGAPGAWEKIFDFGTGPLNDNIYLGRLDTSGKVILSIRNGDVQCGISSTDSFIVPDTWMDFVVQYTSSSKLLELKIADVTLSVTCDVPVLDRRVSQTYVGMSNWPDDPSSLQGSIAGLYTVDQLLSDEEIAMVTSRVYNGSDTIQACETCPVNKLSVQGSTSEADCTLSCPAGEFESESMVSNVARTCGPTENAACPAQLSSSHPSFPASNGNDGDLESMAHVMDNYGPHTFRIDFEKTRTVQYIKFVNRESFSNRIVGAQIRVGFDALWENNPICPDADLDADLIQNRTCNLSGRYIFIVVSAARAAQDNPLNFMEFQAFAATMTDCMSCPSNAVSLQRSTAVDACECQADFYAERRVFNVPHAQRKYSSIGWNIYGSLLDDLSNGNAWASNPSNVGEWMEMDAGRPMHIVGIITQGRGYSATFHYVKRCRVEYRIADISGSDVAIAGTFSMTDGSKKQHTFSQPVYARYIRIVVLEWNNWISMRAGLVVQSCSQCLSNTVSPPGSIASGGCECSSGAYKLVHAFNNNAIALVPGQAQLSTLANRDQREYASTAVFDSTAGPPGSQGAVTFDRAILQYMDGGAHTFNIATNEGFTAVILLRCSGSIENWGRIFDFSDSAGLTNDIVLSRFEGGSKLFFGIYTAGVSCSFVTADGFLLQNTWQTIVTTYSPINAELKIRVGSLTTTETCTTTLPDMVVSSTHIGAMFDKQQTNSYFLGSMAGVYAVDQLLSEAEIAKITSKMYQGEDTLQALDEKLASIKTHIHTHVQAWLSWSERGTVNP